MTPVKCPPPVVTMRASMSTLNAPAAFCHTTQKWLDVPSYGSPPTSGQLRYTPSSGLIWNGASTTEDGACTMRPRISETPVAAGTTAHATRNTSAPLLLATFGVVHV